MRIIAGEYKGRVLKSPPDVQTRPTSDRLRETLFNIISPRINGARFMDLCAGSGAVGLEALSRGAAHTTFVDRSRNAVNLIESNLKLCRVEKERYEVVLSNATDFLKRKITSFDIVFYDPPYSDDYTQTLSIFAQPDSSLLSANSLLIVEHHRKNQLFDEINSLKRKRTVKQGDTILSFYEVRN